MHIWLVHLSALRLSVFNYNKIHLVTINNHSANHYNFFLIYHKIIILNLNTCILNVN